MLTLDLTQLPEWQALAQTVAQQAAEIAALRRSLPEWVSDEEARRLTGLSRSQLWRERQVGAGSLIVAKEDPGLRYLRSSLLDYNESRARSR